MFEEILSATRLTDGARYHDSRSILPSLIKISCLFSFTFNQPHFKTDKSTKIMKLWFDHEW